MHASLLSVVCVVPLIYNINDKYLRQYFIYIWLVHLFKCITIREGLINAEMWLMCQFLITILKKCPYSIAFILLSIAVCPCDIR